MVNFNASSGKSENLHFDGVFCTKYVMFELKKYRGVMAWEMTYGCQNDIFKGFGKFSHN